MDRHGPASETDYEQLRRHLHEARSEHPIARQAPQVAVTAPVGSDGERVSVMEWLLALGHVVARRLRGTPSSALVRLHPKQ